jgi:hypothetical protein
VARTEAGFAAVHIPYWRMLLVSKNPSGALAAGFLPA